MFIDILADPDQPFDWQFVDPDTRRTYDSVFSLRMIPDEVEKDLRRKHTTVEYVKHQPIEKLDGKGFSADVIDYAILNWTGVNAVRGTKRTPIECTRANKLALPDKVRADIIRVVLGHEAGLDVGAQIGAVPSKS